MKWTIDVKAGKNYHEKHVYIPLRLSTDHVTCGRALTKYKYMIVASTGSTFNTHSHRHHRPSPIMSHDDDDDSSSRLETRHDSRYKRRR